MALRHAAEKLGLRVAATPLVARSMSTVIDGLKYMKSHEWARNEDDGSITVGITEHAASELGDVVYAELPDVGDNVSQGESFGTLESVKAASDVYSPVSGTVQSVNSELGDSPGKVNEDPYGGGWMMKVKVSDSSELEKLMDANVCRLGF